MLQEFPHFVRFKSAACAAALMAACLGQAAAQVATSATITSVTTNTSTVNSTSSTVPGSGSGSFPTNTNYNLNYGGESLGMTSFATSTTTYNPINYAGTITTSLVRVSSPLGTNQNNNLVFQRITGSGTNSYNLAGPYNGSEQALFNSNNLNVGTDNLFGNQGDGSGNNNNVERVDVVFSLGLTVSDALAFVVLERGTTNAHDGFSIAAIVSIDGNGAPTAYGSKINFAAGTYGTTDLLSSETDWLVIRNNAADANGPAISPSAAVSNQAIGGTTIAVAAATSAQGLGMSSGTTIYGYSLFATDVTATTSAELLNVASDTLFPKNTSSNTGAGGIDLSAYTGVAVNAVPEPSLAFLLSLAGVLAALGRRRRTVAP